MKKNQRHEITPIMHIIAGLAAIDDLANSARFRKGIATASDPEAMTKKMDAMRKHFKEQALQVSYESKQKLASILREMAHVLTDLIHAMNVNGEDASAMMKLQSQAGKITRSMSFVGEDDADGDGIKDSIKHSVGLTLGDNNDGDSEEDEKPEDHNEAFKSAVKSLKPTDTQTEDKPDVKTLPKQESKSEPEDGEDEDGDLEEEDTNSVDPENQPEEKPKPVKKKLLKKSKPVADSEDADASKPEGKDSGKKGFVETMLAESSFQAIAGMRFVYMGPKNVKKGGESISVILAGFGSHSDDSMKVYYYKPSSKFFGGDTARIDNVFKKILESGDGYSKLSQELNARVKSGHLEIVARKEKQASEVLDSEGSWSYRGVGQHPKNNKKKALWFEIGAQEFAAVPHSRFESGDVEEADAYIRTHIVGSKQHGSVGKSYLEGLTALEKLVASHRLKVIFHANIRS